MATVEFPWDAQLVSVRREVCPRATWDTAHCAWVMSDADAAAFLRAAQAAYLARLPEHDRPSIDNLPTDPGLLASAFRRRLRAAMRIPATEALFPAPWTVAARRVLPSPSPQLTATAMWGPILAWCALELLAESIDIQNPERVALDLFDRLRLREPFAQSFAALGFEGLEWSSGRASVPVLPRSLPGRDTDAGDVPADETGTESRS